MTEKEARRFWFPKRRMKNFKRIHKTREDMVEELYYDAHLGDFCFYTIRAFVNTGGWLMKLVTIEEQTKGIVKKLYLN